VSWKTAYLESRVLSASPLELINILYEYAIRYVEAAQEDLARGDIRGRSKAISKAMAIIGELQGSLDHSAGGEIATNLARLYLYMLERLMTANRKQEAAPLAEVESLLKTLGRAWNEISAQPAAAVTRLPQAPAVAIWTAPAFELADGQRAYTWSA